VFRVTVTCEEFRAQSTKDGTVQPRKYHGFVAPVARAQTSLTNSMVSSCGDERRRGRTYITLSQFGKYRYARDRFVGSIKKKSGTGEITTNCLEMVVCCTRSVSVIIIIIFNFGKEDFRRPHFT